MSSTTHRPRQYSSRQRQISASRSRPQVTRTDVFKGGAMRDQVLGYIGLAGMTGATHAAGVDFLSLTTAEGRAWWLAGAALVLWLVTCRGWHSSR